jgi:hypothetical protein
VQIGIQAFEGCTGTTTCGETFTVRFDRLEGEVTTKLDFDWSVYGFVSTIEAAADSGVGETEPGTLEFEISGE